MDDTISGRFTYRGDSRGERKYLENGETYNLILEKIPRVSRLSGYVKWGLKYRATIQLDDEYATAVHYKSLEDFNSDWEQA